MSERTRVSTFSAWTSPDHVIVDDVDVEDAVFWARSEQKGVVLTSENDDEPESWNGPGVEDRRQLVCQ